jgi:hypothetical protein
MGEGQDTAGHSHTDRVSVHEAAEALSTTVDAIRKRVQRDTIPYEKDADGRVWILLDADRTRHDIGQDTTGYRQDLESSALISAKDETIATLKEQLEAERQAHAEARRLLMAALERIPPQLNAPESSETIEDASESAGHRSGTEEAQTDTEAPQSEPARPWWRRIWR